MAVSAVSKLAGSVTFSANNVAQSVGSVTTVTGRVYLLLTSTSVTPSNVLGLSWSAATTLGSSLPFKYFWATCTSGASGNLLAQTSDGSSDSVIELVEFDGADGAAPIVQAKNTEFVSSPVSVTMSAFGSATNAVWMWALALNVGSVPTAITLETGFTQVSSASLTDGSLMKSGFRSTPDTTPSYTVTNGTQFNVLNAFEIKEYVVPPNDSGTVFAGAGATSGGTVDWTSPGNITASDGSYATMVPAAAASNGYLNATNFGFSIPSGATIVGVEAYVERSRSDGTTGEVQDDTVQLLKAGTLAGSNLGATSTNWPTVEASATYGSASNLWGTTLTDTDVNASDFGVSIRTKGVGAAATTSLTNCSTATVGASATVNWVNPGNITSADSVYASCTATGSGATTATNFQMLQSTGYGFAIPIDATINAIEVSIRRIRTGGTTGEMRFETVQLLKAGTAAGANKATTTNFPTAVAAVAFGNVTSDLWSTTWTPADVNATNFGAQVRLIGSTATTNRVGSVDSIQIRVNYTPAGDRTARVDAVSMKVYYTGGTSGGGSTKTFTATVAEAQSITDKIARSRPFAAASSQAQSVTASLTKPRGFDSAVSQSSSTTAAVIRSRKTASAIAESESFNSALARLKTFTPAVAEAAAVTALVKRATRLGAAVAEAESAAATTRRARAVVPTVTETETVTPTLGTQLTGSAKSFAASVAQAQGVAVQANRRRGTTTSVAESQSVAAQVGRRRGTQTSIAQSQSVTAATRRNRGTSASSALTQSVVGRISLRRGISASVAESEALQAFLNVPRVQQVPDNTFDFGGIDGPPVKQRDTHTEHARDAADRRSKLEAAFADKPEPKAVPLEEVQPVEAITAQPVEPLPFTTEPFVFPEVNISAEEMELAARLLIQARRNAWRHRLLRTITKDDHATVHSEVSDMRPTPRVPPQRS